MEKITLADGRVTLYQGDCRAVPLADACAAMIFTDPPYGHNNNNNGDLIQRREAALGRGAEQPGRPIAQDDAQSAADLVRWLFTTAPRLLQTAGCCCCCCCCCCGGGGGGPDPQFARWSLLMNEHLKFKQMVIWDKGPMGMGWHYRRSYETVLVGEKKGAAKSRWYRVEKTIENIIRPGMYGIRKIIPTKADHPTPKPPALAEFFILNHTQPGEVVLDPYMGSGSTGVAALRSGRRFIGIEIDPAHFAAAVQRIEREWAALAQP